MLKYGNRDFRSLQEQVYANMRNIEDIIKGQDIMADYTLQIVGQVDTAAKLPDAETYDGKLGDIYVVGEQSPFHGYAFVKVYENENVPSWVDLGAILVQGPKGEQGEQGEQGPQGAQGPQGDQGVPAGFGVPTASIQGGVGTPNVSITASGPNTARIFDFTFYNLKGEKGDPGAGVQDFSISDAGKALVVNSTGTATEWNNVGLSPEDQEKLDNSLQLPESAPASQQLVGINTSKEQNALGIGNGLAISDNALGLNMLVLDFNRATTNVSISDTIHDNINNFVYDFIKVINYSSSKLTYIFIPSHNADASVNSRVYQTMLTVYKDTSAPLRKLIVQPITLNVQGKAGNYQAAVWTATVITPYDGGSKNLQGASGTWGGDSWNSFKNKYIYETSCYWRLTNSDPYALIQWQTINGSGAAFYAVGKAEVYASDGTLSGTYKIVIDNAGNYTATAIQ